jgi:hypothetical protein
MAGLPLSATRPDITPSSISRLQRQDTTLGSLSASSSSQQAGTFQAVYDYLRPVRVWFALHGALSIANFICQNSPSRAVNGRVIACAACLNRTTWCRFTVESVHESCDETAASVLNGPVRPVRRKDWTWTTTCSPVRVADLDWPVQRRARPGRPAGDPGA